LRNSDTVAKATGRGKGDQAEVLVLSTCALGATRKLNLDLRLACSGGRELAVLGYGGLRERLACCGGIDLSGDLRGTVLAAIEVNCCDLEGTRGAQWHCRGGVNVLGDIGRATGCVLRRPLDIVAHGCSLDPELRRDSTVRKSLSNR